MLAWLKTMDLKSHFVCCILIRAFLVHMIYYVSCFDTVLHNVTLKYSKMYLLMAVAIAIMATQFSVLACDKAIYKKW